MTLARSAKKVARPRLTKKVVEGLRVVEKLAWADLESTEAEDESEYEHGTLACQYLRDLLVWYSARKAT